MPYTVPKSDPTQPPITVSDGTVNVTDTSISLIGRNYPNYGQALAENFVHLLENFSNTSSPSNPIKGQLWYDSEFRKLKLFDGLQWVSMNTVYPNTSTGLVVNPEIGDVFVDTNQTKLKIYNGLSWVEPANTPLITSSITSQTAITTASDSAQLLVADSNNLYRITKSNFLGNTVTPNLVKTGTIVLWPMDVEPPGWKFCNGQFLSTSSYSSLWSLIQYRYGSTGTNQFKLPNLTGPTTTDTSITLNYIIKT
jgi:hypothetical protein